MYEQTQTDNEQYVGYMLQYEFIFVNVSTNTAVNSLFVHVSSQCIN